LRFFAQKGVRGFRVWFDVGHDSLQQWREASSRPGGSGNLKRVFISLLTMPGWEAADETALRYARRLGKKH